MFEEFWRWTGDIHLLLPEYWVGIVVTVAAVICGGLIGLERERAQKPAGMRTLILICLGAAIFAQASILIAGESFADRGRIAAQVVSGIGFLGAGAIIRERGLLIGVTTGASIWATAAVGVVVGSGYVAAGIFFSIMILGTLSAARIIDRAVVGPCRYKTLRLTYDPGDGKVRFRIQAVLDEHQHEGAVSFDTTADGLGQASIIYCDSHRDHRSFLHALMSLPEVSRARSD
jgi:putative Mg2+ transporter-C (MgtC) family protein